MIVERNFKQLFAMSSGDNTAYTKRELMRLLGAVVADVEENLPQNAVVHDVIVDVSTATCNIYYTDENA